MANTSSGGWHPDPTGRHQHRWWDGTQWTDQVADGGVSSTDPMTEPPATPVAPAFGAGGPAFGAGGPPAARKGANWKVIGIVGGVLVAVIALVVVLVVVTGGTSREEQVDACVARGTPRSQCECVIDEYLDNGGTLDELNEDFDEDEDDIEDLPEGLVEAFFSCLEE